MFPFSFRVRATPSRRTPQPLRLVLAACVASTTVLLYPAHADDKAIAPVVVPGAPVLSPAAVAPVPRVFDAAPTLSFSTLDGRPWNSRDLLGQRGALILFLPDAAVQGPNKAPELWMQTLADAAPSLRAASIEPALLLSAQGARSLLQKVPPAAPGLQTLAIGRDVETLRPLFGAEEFGATLVFVDQAGFWRDAQTLSSPAGLAATLQQVPRWKPKIEIGKAAPDFSVPTSGGRAFRLADLRGKRSVLLTFFPKCFTGGCTNHLTSLRDQQEAFDAASTQIVAVSVDPADGPHGQLAFAARWNFGFSLVPDVNRNLSLLYGAATSPNQVAARISVLIDKDGLVRWMTRDVNVRTHGADVLAALREQGLAPAP